MLWWHYIQNLRFENGVIYDGTQTYIRDLEKRVGFENGVIYDGTQTELWS